METFSTLLALCAGNSLVTGEFPSQRPVTRSFDVFFHPGLAGFFHLVEETGLNPGLNRPGRNRFLPPEVEKTAKKFKMHDKVNIFLYKEL